MFYPADAVAAERATELAANTRGIAFIRTGRPACPVIYRNDEKFQVGKGKVGTTITAIEINDWILSFSELFVFI